MKGTNWLKLICHQGRSLVTFSVWNISYKSVVLSLIWLLGFLYQIHNKRMSQLVAYSGNICVWVVSCNECGGWQLGRRSASIKHPWPKIWRQKLIFEKIVYQSKRGVCKMGGPDTADLCAVDLDPAPSNLRTNHTFKVLLHQFKTPSVYLSVWDKTCLGTSIPFLGTIYIP